MARDLSYERSEFVFFLTTRTMNSKLWFVNNLELQYLILAFLARFQEMFGVIIYGFVLMGNHYHLMASFPKNNKMAFFRAFNSVIAKLTNSQVTEFEGGKLWARPVRAQLIGDQQDLKDRFFYTTLNPVGAGLVKKLSEYPGYNSFSDAIVDKRRKFKIFLREEYYNRRRHNPKITPADCTVEHTLTFTRLPGHDHMSRKEYMTMMHKELEERRVTLVNNRLKEGKAFATKEILLKLVPGASPRSTKTSKRDSKRPLILTSSFELKQRFLDWYFALREAYREASKRFRAGDLNAVFPPGTYRPPSFCVS